MNPRIKILILCLSICLSNGVLQGLCKYFDENGTLTSEGAFLENERNGKWKFYSPKTSKLSSQITIVKYDKGQALSTKVSTY